MSEKTRYFKIGLFTLMALALLGIGLFLFGMGTMFQAPPIRAETYFWSSVQGLDVGAPVKLKGVKVGKVKDILFVKDLYGQDKTLEEIGKDYTAVCVRFEFESRYFRKFTGMSRREAQKIIDRMVDKLSFRAKLESIGITGLMYLELGFYDPAETPKPRPIAWKPKDLYIPSAPGVATRLGESLDKFLNKLDTEVYPLLSGVSQAAGDFPAIVSDLKQILPHVSATARNLEDLTSTAKKYPSQLILGEAPPKSRYDR